MDDKFPNDESCIKLTNAFFLNLLRNIQSPGRLGYKKNNIEGIKRWYNDVLDWCYKDMFWFACWEAFTGYDGKKLRDIIITKIENKLANL